VSIVGYRPDLPGVADSARRTRRLLLIGDGALIAAVVLVGVRVGNVDLVGRHGPVAGAHRLGDLHLAVALLVVVAALTRCAQGPLGGWLPGTIAAPTPVSALLHAGFVNGGGILLVRMGAFSGNSVVAMAIAFAVAALTAVGATAVMAHRADVKGDLAYSTMGQMGFMVAECAVGASGAAVVHLVGHAVYKATLFMGSGAGVRRPGQVVAGRDRGWSLPRAVVAVVAGVAAAAMVAIVPGVPSHRGGGPLLVFVGATAGLGAWSWWSIRRTRMMAGWLVVTVVASAVYGLLSGGLAGWLQPSLPAVGTGTLDPWLLLVVAAGGVATAVATRVPSLGTRVQVLLVDAGSPGQGASIRAVRGRPTTGPRPTELNDVATARSAA
jgi:NADH:ubiquinone oxidoreductase subunit 5 (subunit L)/multisubunit Na+/H+ antiporter MnhA subunit